MNIYSTEIRGTPEKVVRAFEEEAAQLNLSLLHKTNMRTKLWSKGIQLDQDYWVMELFDPNLSKKILAQYPKLGIYLPGKIAIYPRTDSHHVQVDLFLPTQTASEEIPIVRPWLRSGERKMMELIKRVQGRL